MPQYRTGPTLATIRQRFATFDPEPLLAQLPTLRLCISTRWAPAAADPSGNLPLRAPTCQLCDLANSCATCVVGAAADQEAGCSHTPYQDWAATSGFGESHQLAARRELAFLKRIERVLGEIELAETSESSPS